MESSLSNVSGELSNDVSSDSDSSSSSPSLPNDGRVDLPEAESIKKMKQEAYRKFEEAAELRKGVDNFLDGLSKGELDRLMEIVPEDKLYDFAEKMLRKKIDWEETPKDKKERIIAERERDKYKRELEEYSKKEQEQIRYYANEKAAKELDGEIIGVINELEQTHGKMVKSPEFVQDIARYMLAELENGATNVNAKRASEFALKSWRKRIGSYVNNISHDDLRKYLTKEQIEALRKSDLDSALSQFPSNGKKDETGKVIPKKKKSFKGFNDFFDNLDKQYG